DLGAGGCLSLCRSLGSEYVRQSVAPSNQQTYKHTFGTWAIFCRLIREKYFLRPERTVDEQTQALLRSIAWCFAVEGNQ
ncbi:unnamed protein product, partial [Pylaiella littoralis]